MARTAPTPTPTAWRRVAAQAACGLAVLAACAPAQADSDAFWGALMPMAGKPGGGTCPKYWLPAEGQILPISQNTVLFSIFGNTYGGNGTTTFALPDLRGRTPVGMGQGPGLSPLDWGEQGGSASTTLSSANLPAHSHGVPATAAAATHAAPGEGRTLAQAQNAGVYASGGTQVTLGQSAPAGQSAPIPTMSPYVAIIWCVATQGTFPQRP